MKKLLIDKFGRQLDYLRLSVTDRCNFRCYYCMPEEGVNFADRNDILTFGEMEMLVRIFVSLGVNKVRITGGEPFVRKGIMGFLDNMSQTEGLDQITVTSNGTLSTSQIAELKRLGILKINISLDALDRQRFFEMTRRDRFEEVYSCIIKLMEEGFQIKLNCVVAEEKNIQDIIPFVELTKSYPLAVRFLEQMPFNGKSFFSSSEWDHKKIFSHISQHYHRIQKLDDEKNGTSVNYKIPGYLGSFGIIPSFSRTFCGTCNRIRLSATGELRTCLYGPPASNLRDLIRDGASINDVENEILEAVAKRKKDGFEAEKSTRKEPKKAMTFLGG